MLFVIRIGTSVVESTELFVSPEAVPLVHMRVGEFLNGVLNPGYASRENIIKQTVATIK